MSSTRPDVERILAGLKDFQRDSVEHIFGRLYGPDDARRFLLADEVGLGKTLVAKGLIAKAVDYLWDEVERIDVVYICSNAEIARQNLARLRPADDGFVLPSRITLLPLKLANLNENKVNLVSFTPGTSFDTHSAMGIAQERALLYHLLRTPWELGRRKGPQRLLQGSMRELAGFRGWIDAIDPWSIDEGIAGDFTAALAARPDLRERFSALLARFSREVEHRHLKLAVKHERVSLISELRRILARTCVRALQPDLILLDEFQRFKELLATSDDPDSAGALAHELFDWQDAESDAHAKVLLMSATPYKMYTLDGEHGDEHFRDFVDTLEFLMGTERAKEVGAELVEFRRELVRPDRTDDTQLSELHASVERRLREVIVRTERVTATASRDGMLKMIATAPGRVSAADVRDYLIAQRVARIVKQSDVLEWWKSSPYLLNLLGDGYKLGREVRAGVDSAPVRRQLAAVLAEARLLEPGEIRKWAEIDPGNARMRSLIHDTVGSGAWQLLWVPPAMPHYAPSGPYADTEVAGFTKRLVFSSWQIVPRAIAALVSYAAERALWQAAEPGAENTQEVRDARRGRLQFAVTNGRLTGMPALALLFPSTVLSSLCDPREFAAQHGNTCDVDALRGWARARIEAALKAILPDVPSYGAEDESWYWAAPLLLDVEQGDTDALDWIQRSDAATAWSGREQDDGRWTDHVERAQMAARGELELGVPPERLLDVLTEIGLFGFGNSALRALRRIAYDADPAELRVQAARIGWSMRTLFNLPEICAFVPSLFPKLPYWRQCLRYAEAGGLQAVLDEYAHLLVEGLGHDRGTEAAIAEVAERIAATMSLRASLINGDAFDIDTQRETVQIDRLPMRARFAARFGQEVVDDEGKVARPDALRAAFNSPFWPFVLASTSVGQEGLDFHYYCHAITHWNLPPNPVDLEQREGRIHRYKNHAVRKNLAARYRDTPQLHSGPDSWAHVFELAKRERPEGANDLVPYWLFEGNASIERHVPLLPLSSEISRLTDLRRSLAVYRMAFGQARQEDLVALLLDRFNESEVLALVERLAINLTPAHEPLVV